MSNISYKKKRKGNKKHTRKRNKNQTKKTKNTCPISLKPFEKEYDKQLAKMIGKQTSKISGKKMRTIETLKKKDFARELLSKFAPASIKPNDNFYDYINYTWLKNVSLEKQQKYIVQVDSFRLTQDKVYRELDEIIVHYFQNHNNKLAKNLKNYYKSVIDMNPKSYSKQLAQEAVQLVDTFIQNNNPWGLLAYFNNDEMLCDNAPFVWSLAPDNKEPDIFRCYIEPIRFIILDLNVYYDDGTDVMYKQKYRNMYYKNVQNIFDTTIGKNDFNAKDCFETQVDIFTALGCMDVTKKPSENNYNKVHRKDAMKYGFQWDEFSKQLGFKTPPDFFITSSLNYLKCGTDLFLKNWNTPRWRTYWIYLLLKRLVRITKEWEHITFEFYGEFERGQDEINVSDAVSASLYMSLPFNTFLTDEYVNKYQNEQAMKYTKTLCEDLKIVFRRILKRNKWLQPSTKEYALKKLDHFHFVYGKHEKSLEDPDLTYTTVTYDNLKMLMDWRHQKFIHLEGKKTFEIPMMDWTQYPVKMLGTQAYVVNASYTPSKNSIFLNLGYIQKPFIDLEERGIEYNLAHIGVTIAHEMGHSLDDFGSQYSYDGKLHNWWTEKDKKHYKKIQKDVKKQYEEFAARDGIIFDAEITLGESLADIAALAICSEYLRDFQDKNKNIIPIRAISFEAFYTYFAFQQRQLVKKKAISAQIKTNPHPLDKYRCNVPLSRSIIFRSLYDVKKGDGMYWHNTNTIW